MTPFDVFQPHEIAMAINKIPNRYGRVNELNLMPVRGTVSRQIAIEEQNGVLSLIPISNDRGPGVVGKSGSRKVRTFNVPQLVYDEFVSPQDVAGIRAFGGNQLANLATLLNDKLAAARAKHDITLEHLRMGALKGVIADADGSTVYDLFSEFGIAKKSVDFVLGTGTTDVRAKCMEVVRHIEDNLNGELATGVRALVSAEFFDKLVAHAKVKEAYSNYQEAAQRIGGDMRKGFTFGGITFEEYRATATGADGNARRFIAANEGHAFPVGTTQTFATFAAPADFNESVNTLGQLYYAKTAPAKHDRGYDIHTQSNPLPMCARPAVLVELTTSN